MDRLRRHVFNELVFVIDKEEFVVNPKVGDKIRLLETISKADKGAHIPVFTNYITELITNASDDADPAVIEAFVDSNIEELIKQLSIGFKLAKAEQFTEKVTDPN